MAFKHKRKLALPDEILLSIEKPARYTGNEINMVKKDPRSVQVLSLIHI